MSEGYELIVDAEREVQLPTLAVPAGSEIDIQIATARRYPRSLTLFKQRVIDLAGINSEFAQECTYKLPRNISGPSVRFAEVLAHCYGNNRVAARIVDIDEKFVTAQGAFFDLETNVATTFDVKVQVRDKDGNAYSDSLVATSCNAACAKALRSAVMKGIPKSIWEPLHTEVRRIAIQGPQDIETKRRQCFQFCEQYGITPEQVLVRLDCRTPDDIDSDKLDELREYIVAVKEGHATVEELFGPRPPREPNKARRSPLNDIIDGKRNGNGSHFAGSPTDRRFTDANAAAATAHAKGEPAPEVGPSDEWPDVGKAFEPSPQF